MFQLVKVVLVSIRTKFELSMCLVCPTIEINVCSAYLQNVLVRFFFLLFKHCETEKTALLCKGSLEKGEKEMLREKWLRKRILRLGMSKYRKEEI